MFYTVKARHEYTAGEYMMDLELVGDPSDDLPLFSVRVDFQTWKQYGVGQTVQLTLEAA